MSPQKILYVLTQAPYSNAQGQEALDMLLIGAAFEQDVSVLFMQNGVFQLKDQQNTEQSTSLQNIKQFTKTFRALEDFGVENIYVDELSLLSRGLTTEQLMIDVSALNSLQIKTLLAEQFRVFTF